MVIFLLPNTVFAWFEYVTSLIKIFLFLLIILLSLALVLGAGPHGYVHHGETWTQHPAFLNGFAVRWHTQVILFADLFGVLQVQLCWLCGQSVIKCALELLGEKCKALDSRWRTRPNLCRSVSTSSI